MLCFNRKTGKQVWQTEVHRGAFPKGNDKSSFASAAPGESAATSLRRTRQPGLCLMHEVICPMSEPQLVDPHDPVMTGENSYLRLSTDGGTTFVHRTSHWRVLWSPVGQGHVLFMESPLVGSSPRIYADNAAVARFLQRTIEVMLHKPFADESLPITDAKFERAGHSLSTVEERIVSPRDTIILSWWNLMSPFVLTMPPGTMGRPLGVYSTFLPAREAQLAVNGETASGQVVLQDRFGRPASSCCLAWSETWTKPKA